MRYSPPTLSYSLTVKKEPKQKESLNPVRYNTECTVVYAKTNGMLKK